MTKMAATPVYGKKHSKIFFSRTGWPIFVVNTVTTCMKRINEFIGKLDNCNERMALEAMDNYEQLILSDSSIIESALDCCGDLECLQVIKLCKICFLLPKLFLHIIFMKMDLVNYRFKFNNFI